MFDYVNILLYYNISNINIILQEEIIEKEVFKVGHCDYSVLD